MGDEQLVPGGYAFAKVGVGEEVEQTRSSGGRVGLSDGVVAIGGLLMGMWVLEVVDQASGNSLDGYGIRAARPTTACGTSSPPRCCTAAGRT